MIRIERITLREIHLPLVEPFRTASGTVDVRRILLLELVDAGGGAVWSECVAQAEPGYSTETIDSCWQAIERLFGPVLMASTIDSPMQADGLLAERAADHRMARAALEMGVWGLTATLQGMPLARMLARESAVTGEGQLRAQVETGIALGLHASASALAARARAALAEGYRRVKLKITPEDALQSIAAVRAEVGEAGRLSADANGSFSLDDPEHRRILEALDQLGLTMLEQPLPPDDRWRGGILQHRMATPICLDERILDVGDVEHMLKVGSARIVNLKPGRVAGYHQALAIHDFCLRKSVPLWCGGMLESGIGRAYNVALASLPGFTEPGDLSPSARYWARDIVTPAWIMDAHGRVNVPLDRPGLGVDVDVGFIDDCTVRTAEVRARRR